MLARGRGGGSAIVTVPLQVSRDPPTPPTPTHPPTHPPTTLTHTHICCALHACARRLFFGATLQPLGAISTKKDCKLFSAKGGGLDVTKYTCSFLTGTSSYSVAVNLYTWATGQATQLGAINQTPYTCASGCAASANCYSWCDAAVADWATPRRRCM